VFPWNQFVRRLVLYGQFFVPHRSLASFHKPRTCLGSARRLVVEEHLCLFDSVRNEADRLFQAEPTVEVLDDSIALTGGFFEGFAVQYFHRAAHVFNQSAAFEDARR